MFTINLDIDPTGVGNINSSHQFVTLVKSVVSDQSGPVPVAWITFAPFPSNVITWDETYFIYASETALQGGAQLALTAQTEEPAQEGFTYTLFNNVFTGAAGSGSTYKAANGTPANDLSFGLAQPATHNGNAIAIAPLNAIQLLANEGVAFTPEETLSIFLSSNANNGSVLSEVSSKAVSFTLTSQTPTANIGFNKINNTFFVTSIEAQLAA